MSLEQAMGAEPAGAVAPVSSDTQGQQQQQEQGSDNTITREDVLSNAPFLRASLKTEDPIGGKTPESQALDELMGKEVSDQQGTEQAQAEPEAEQPQPQPEAPQSVKLHDGSEVTLDELQRGYLRQSDYTRKTQALAEQRKAIENAVQEIESFRRQASEPMQLWEAMQRDPIGTLDYLREQYANMGILEPRDPAEIEREVARQQLERERQQVMAEKSQLHMTKAEMEFNRYLQDLSGKYQDFDAVAVLDYAVANKITDPEVAYRAMSRDTVERAAQQKIAELEQRVSQAETEAIKRYLASKAGKAQQPAKLGSSGTGGAAPTGFEPTLKTFDEGKLSALARIRQYEQST